MEKIFSQIAISNLAAPTSYKSTKTAIQARSGAREAPDQDADDEERQRDALLRELGHEVPGLEPRSGAVDHQEMSWLGKNNETIKTANNSVEKIHPKAALHAASSSIHP